MKRNKSLEKIRAAISPEENVREQQWGLNESCKYCGSTLDKDGECYPCFSHWANMQSN